jgi:hypothetical protein
MALGSVLVAAMLLVSGVLIFNTTKKENVTDSTRSITSIPTQDLLKVTNDDLSGLGQVQVQVNGPLRVAATFTIAPSSQPQTASAGQIYYDQNTNQFSYFDGKKFQNLIGSDSINNLGGLSRANAGAGLALNGNLLTNTGVTSLQGQTGALGFQAGAGIAINGLQITNLGITSIQGTANQVLVGINNGVATLALPQAIAPTSSPNFAGLSLSSPLGVSSGGTGRAG